MNSSAIIPAGLTLLHLSDEQLMIHLHQNSLDIHAPRPQRSRHIYAENALTIMFPSVQTVSLLSFRHLLESIHFISRTRKNNFCSHVIKITTCSDCNDPWVQASELQMCKKRCVCKDLKLWLLCVRSKCWSSVNLVGWRNRWIVGSTKDTGDLLSLPVTC